MSSQFLNRKIVSFSFLLGISFLTCFGNSVLAENNRSPQISSKAITALSKPNIQLPTVTVAKQSTLISQSMGGALTVSNGTNRDAFVKLIEPNYGILVGAFFVKANSSYTLEQIPDGTYRVLFVLGQGWNPNTQTFTKNKHFARFDKSLPYITTQFGNSISFKAFKITLHPVVGGNTTTSGLNEQEFNRY
jgi:hypothetical protein